MYEAGEDSMDFEGKIVFKGNSEGLIIIIPEDMEYVQILEEINLKIEAAGKFFKGASINVLYRGKELSYEQELELKDNISSKSGAFVNELRRDDKVIENESPITDSKFNMRTIFFKGIEQGDCRFVRGTLRSGTLIKHEGNVVVIGDVNPGAEIIAAVNVVVMGTVRGLIHAGCDGNRSAFVSAICLKPTQIRIADCIARCPDDEGKKINPEIAYVKDGAIYVDTIH